MRPSGDWGDSGESGSMVESGRLTLETPDLALRPDLTDAASDFSTAAAAAASPLDSKVEFLGLSVFPPPGILDRKERNERVESLVSDLLKLGYDCRLSPGPPPPPLEPPSLEVWFPIADRYPTSGVTR